MSSSKVKMKNWINNLRAKPEATRRRLAFLYALVGTAIIALVWLVNTGVEFSNLGQPALAEVGPSPAQMMLSAINENVGRIKSGASQVGAVINSVDATLRGQAVN